MKKFVQAECSSCNATGLYSGMCEAEGTAVVCLGCNGTGCETVSFTPFTKRRGRRDIKTVYRSGGRFIMTGTGPVGSSITYSEFTKGKMPS